MLSFSQGTLTNKFCINVDQMTTVAYLAYKCERFWTYPKLPQFPSALQSCVASFSSLFWVSSSQNPNSSSTPKQQKMQQNRQTDIKVSD